MAQISGTNLNDVLSGTPGDDTIEGDEGDDILIGNGGNDYLDGGAGDDDYEVDSTTDILTEALDAGNDTVNASVSWTLGANFENLTLTGTASINATGNTLANTLTGNTAANMLSGGLGDDILNGGVGTDIMIGGAGNDIYYVDNTGDITTETSTLTTEIDTVVSSVTYTLGNYLENLTLSGTAAIDGTGNALANTLIGNTAANILNGGAGADTMTGGTGNDTYHVDNSGDVVTETSNETTEIDTVISSVTYILGDYLENMTLSGTAAIDGIGNALANTLTGNTAANILIGGLGDDILNGGAGADTMTGGTGNDTYHVDSSGDVVTETSNETTEIDTVVASITYTLGDYLENLTLSGIAVINGTGNALANTLTGNTAANILIGGAGEDTMTGGTGNDTYHVDNSGDVVTETSNEITEIDTVVSSITYTLGDYLENLTLSGTAVINGTGNALANTLTGNTAANILIGGLGDDILNGGAGADTMTGGTGNDTYHVDSSGDVITETSNETTEIDTVVSSVTYTLGNYLENLTLSGTAAIDGTGNALANTLIGNTAANILNGGAGADTMTGGTGNDTYHVDNSGDVVTETSNETTEIDTVDSTVTYTLGDYLENLTLSGTAVINGTGNALANTLTGNTAANILIGGLGDDILNGGAGADTMTGGTGNDTYHVDSSGDVITETSNATTEIDTVVSSVTYTLGNYLENLTLSGTAAIDGTGNALANTLTGNTAANILIGGAGADTLTGGTGNDTYHVDNSGDVVTETSNETTEIDTVDSTVTYTLGDYLENLTLSGTAVINGTGNALANTLTGNTAANILSGGLGDDILNGGVGTDTMIGGTGNDTYHVDNSGDVVTETSNATTEIDTVVSSVTYTLGNYLEKLTLSGTAAIDGTGNALANTLTGNTAANILIGGAGEDTMTGGTGNDTYYVDNIWDIATETSNATTEIDTVDSTVTYTLGNYLENLTLSGTAVINGTGNALANTLTGNTAANILIGGLGADILNGGAGADTLTGGTGNDTYHVDNSGDVVTETSNATTEIDTVVSSITYTLGNYLEKLTLSGTAAIDGTGNALANTLTGNTAANILTGGAGADTMTGGTGNDTYHVDNSGDVVTETSNETTEIDTVDSSITYTLGNYLENLTLSGTAVINGTGNAFANTLTGNTAANILLGGLGADILNGGAGADTLTGGTGNDTYHVDNSGDVVTETSNATTEIDTVVSTVTYTLGNHLENLTLSGTAVINGTGNALANTLIGNTAANILNGGAGADTMTGGTGNDTYHVDNSGDVVTETSNETTEIDTVDSTVTYTLGDYLENLTLSGTAVINGTGNALANTLTGNAAANILSGGLGDDILNGGAGADTLTGGTGSDTYHVDNSGDVVTETSNETTEIDTVVSSITYTLGNYLENLTLSGTAVINGTGNALANTMTGNTAANILIGGAGADTMTGGTGNDTYYVDNIWDVVTETSNETTEIDTIISSVTYTLGDYLENLTLSGTAVINGTGNALANTMTGNAAANILLGGLGADILNGGAGVDTMIGGTDNDTYHVDNIWDVVTETSNETTEIDTIISSVTYTLGDYLENLTLSGTAVINGTGNALANTLTGNAAANILTGGAGADTMTGGTGNDTYYVDNIWDIVTETSNATTEIDTVDSTVTYTLGDYLENLTLSGTAVINGTGNALANTLTGNTAANILLGGLGADILNGGAGADTMIGGTGNDTYHVDNSGDVVTETSNETTEIDTVVSSITYTLGNYLEKLTLSGPAAIDGTGNALANTLTGNTAANILNGGAGADTMIGGTGNDTYHVDNSGDIVTETSNETTEIDTVDSTVTYTLGDYLENLTLSGTAVINGTGNALANTLTGNAAANILLGGLGADILNGGAGVDTMTGGTGNDTYHVDNSGDVVTETSNATTEIDTVVSSITYTLGNHLENLTLSGTAAINGTGNALANTLTGNAAANILLGGLGADILNGGAGVDTMIGGTDNDTYYVDNSGDVVTETTNATTEIDTIISSVTYTLGDYLENLTLSGTAAIDGTGNALANTLIGNTAANILNGGAGADTMTGGTGNDTYHVDNSGDVVTETSNETTEIDTVISTVTYILGNYLENLTLSGTAVINGTGNALANTLTGNAAANILIGGLGADILNGGAGADTLTGGKGNDTYHVDNSGDVVTETSNATTEIDTVVSSITYTLGNHLENLTLSGTAVINGTGNALANTLTGNTAANILIGGLGADILNGGASADTMIGGDGSDIYYVDNALDIVTETIAAVSIGGTDMVYSSLSAYTLGVNVENGSILAIGAANLNGNSLNNLLYAGAGNNVLNGSTGTDTVSYRYAGSGVTASLAVTTAQVTGGSGTDTFISIEKLTGSNYNDKFTGNSSANTLSGGLGNDTLSGGAGNDILTGEAGADKFHFNTSLNALTNKDTITDFVAIDDTIQLENAIFAKLTTTGVLSSTNFRASTVGTAADFNDYILYDTDSGALYYDADGNGAGAAVQFALLGASSHPAISNADFVVY